MEINRTKPDMWKKDIEESVDYYNSWFIQNAPAFFKDSRAKAAQRVNDVFGHTDNLALIDIDILKEHPEAVSVLRMATCPPLARDRLVGLSQIPRGMVQKMEDEKNPRLPPRMSESDLDENLGRVCKVVSGLLDRDIFPWIEPGEKPNDQQKERAALIVADRLCGSLSDPILRNAQEQRQLSKLRDWLESRGYRYMEGGETDNQHPMPGTFSFRHNIRVFAGSEPGAEKEANIPVDAYIVPKNYRAGDTPVLIEAKSAGDFVNVNKRRKEEAQKMRQLGREYGGNPRYILFLCGYFDTGYLGYEAAEGIDWVWEHRMSDLEKAGL